MARTKKSLATVAGLGPVELLALQYAVDEAVKVVERERGPLREAIDEGTEISSLVVEARVEVAKLRVGYDTEKTPTVSIPMLATIALLVRRMGVTRDAALQLVREAMSEALTLGTDAEAALVEGEGVLAAVAQVRQEVLDQLPKTPVRRPVSVEGVSVDGAAPAASRVAA